MISTVSANRKPQQHLAVALGALFLIVLLLEAGLFATSGQAPLYRDALGYWKLGAQAASGDWLLLEPAGVTRTPGYPYFVALCQLLFGDRALVVAVALQHFMVVVTAAIAAWIGWRVTGSGLAAVLALALSTMGLSRHVISAYLWSDHLLALLLTAHAALLVAWLRRPGAGWALALGASLGLCTLTRPVAQYAFVPMLLTLGLHLRDGYGVRAWLGRFSKHGLLMLGAMLVVIGPWLVRNQLAFGEPFLTRFQGRNLWASCFEPINARLPFPNSPAVAELLEVARDHEVNPRNVWQLYIALRATGRSELEADDLLAAGARQTIAAMPIDFARSVGTRFFGFWILDYRIPRWRYDPFIKREGTIFDQRLWHSATLLPLHDGLLRALWRPNRVLFGGAALAVLIALIAIARRPGERTLALGFGLLLVYYAIVPAVATTPLYRMRSSLEPLMVAVVVIAATPLLKEWWSRRHRRPTETMGPPP